MTSDTIANMTDEPTEDHSDQPTPAASQPTPPAPRTPPSEPSGVGFAALGPPGQQPPQGIPPQVYPSPPPPLPPGPVYQYDISRMPSNRGSGAPVLLVGGLAFVLVLMLGVGAMLALGVGPFARSTPTRVAQPSPTPAPLATPTPKPTATGPVASPMGSAGPTATPIPSGDIADVLLSHIPEAIRPTCFVTATGGGTILALATCSADDGNIALTYFQYATFDSMFTVYDGFRLASQIEPDSGDCNDHDSWPAENAFNISGQPAGRWLCTETLGQTSLYWTDNRLNILSQANQTTPDYPRLIDFWVHESGPDL